jgi:chromosome segregation ATPase
VERDARIVAADAELERARPRIAELERLAGKVREAENAARRRAAELESECGRLDRALEAQERIIAYRQSFRWWVGLPWMRVKLAWKRVAGE